MEFHRDLDKQYLIDDTIKYDIREADNWQSLASLVEWLDYKLMTLIKIK